MTTASHSVVPWSDYCHKSRNFTWQPWQHLWWRKTRRRPGITEVLLQPESTHKSSFNDKKRKINLDVKKWKQKAVGCEVILSSCCSCLNVLSHFQIENHNKHHSYFWRIHSFFVRCTSQKMNIKFHWYICKSRNLVCPRPHRPRRATLRVTNFFQSEQPQSLYKTAFDLKERKFKQNTQ